MILLSRVYLPRFFKTIEDTIQERLENSITKNWPNRKYKDLLELKQHTNKMMDSLHQLQGISGDKSIDELQKKIHKTLANILLAPENNTRSNMILLRNQFDLVKLKLNEDKVFDKSLCALNILANSIYASAGGLGVLLCAAAVASGPIVPALMALICLAVSALVLAIAAYSVYVDGRFIFDQQIKEIDEGITFIDAHLDVASPKISSEEILPEEFNNNSLLSSPQ